MAFFRDKLILIFLLMPAEMGIGLLYWGMGYVVPTSYLLLLLASLFGMFMAFNIGGNDVATRSGPAWVLEH